MNNLKRILSLALASVMLVGMMVVGASATDYPDDEKIVNKTAVETLAALGIMNGDDRGFRPEDGLKRGEAAKMLAKIHNKGRDVTYGVKDTPTFKDIDGHWAEGNIEYATAFGIVNGKGNGIFDPEGSLRVVELVRMTLNMMGYDEGKTGADWELQTTVLADNVGLFNGLDTFVPTANVTRDEAAQILYNALTADMNNAGTYTENGTNTVGTGKYKIVKGTGTLNPQLVAAANTQFNTFMDAKSFAETIIGSGSKVYGTDYAIEEITVTEKVTSKENLAHKYLSMSKNTGVVRSVSLIPSGPAKGMFTLTTNNDSYTVAADYSKYIGENVQVLYKGNDTDDVYGVFPVSTIVYEGTVGEYQAIVNAMTNATDKAAVLGVVVRDQAYGNMGNLTGVNKAFKVKAVDTDRDRVADTITVESSVYGPISFLGNTTISIGNGAGTLNLKDITLYEGAKVGDWAIVTVTASGTTVTKAEVVTGAIESTNNVGSVRVAGTWYPAGTTVVANTNIGKTFDLVLVNGYYVDANLTQTAASNDLFYLMKIATQPNGLDAATKLARVIGLDGKTQDIKLNPADAATASLTDGDSNSTGKFYTYKQESNGTYTLKLVDNTNKAGYDTVATGNLNWYVQTVGSNTVGSLSNNGSSALNLADDAIVIVANNKAANNTSDTTVTTNVSDLTTYQALTGKDVKSWNRTFGAAAKTIALSKTVNGISYVKLLFIAADASTLPGAAATTNGGYGYVVSAETTFELVGTRPVAVYTIWNGQQNVTVKDIDNAAVAAGTVLSYVENADGTIDSTILSGTANLGTGAVTGWSAADKLVNITKLDGSAEAGVKTFGDKTVFLYVDTAKREGVEGGAAEPMATKLDTGAYVPNVYYVKGSAATDDVVLLVIDVNNKIAGQGDILSTVTVPATANTPALAKDEVRKLNTGVYKYAAGAQGLFDPSDWNTNGKNLIFKFTLRAYDAETVISIKNAAGTELYKETIAANTWSSPNASQFFVVNYGSMGTANEITAQRGQALPSGTYTVTVKNGTTTVLSATFEI